MFLTVMGFNGIMINKWAMHPIQNTQLIKLFLDEFVPKLTLQKSSIGKKKKVYFASSVKKFQVKISH